MKSGLGFIVLCVATLLTTGVARAEDPEVQAQKLFEDGTRAYARHDFEAAASAFEDAFRLAPRGGAAYNAGLAWVGAHRMARAADALELALTNKDLDPKQAEEAKARLADLARIVGVVHVTTPLGATVSVEHVHGAAIPASIHLEPGVHELTIELPNGTRDVRHTTVRAGETVTVAAAPAPLPLIEARPAPVDTGRDPRLSAGWIAAGTTVVAAGVAIGLGVAATTARDQFVDGGDMSVALHDRAVSLRTGTNIAWAVCGVSGATTVILFLTARRSSPARPVALERSLVIRF